MEEFQRNKVFSSIPILKKQKCHNVTKSGVCVCVCESGVRGAGREMKLLVLRFKLILTCVLISVFAF